MTPVEKAAFEYCQAVELLRTTKATCANRDLMISMSISAAENYKKLKSLIWEPVAILQDDKDKNSVAR